MSDILSNTCTSLIPLQWIHDANFEWGSKTEGASDGTSKSGACWDTGINTWPERGPERGQGSYSSSEESPLARVVEDDPDDRQLSSI